MQVHSFNEQSFLLCDDDIVRKHKSTFIKYGYRS